MTLLNLFHEEYRTEGDLVLFRCTECGQTQMSLGSLHAHIEKHRGYTPLGIQIPFTKTSIGNFDRLMEYTEVIRVADIEPIELDDVDGL